VQGRQKEGRKAKKGIGIRVMHAQSHDGGMTVSRQREAVSTVTDGHTGDINEK